jgi:hypothetical protein
MERNTEQMEFDPEANELDLDAHIDLSLTDGRERRMDRNNSILFTHLGELALDCYDHVFIIDGDPDGDPEEDESGGIYVFRHHEAFEALVDFMMENSFPMRLNATKVADCDREAYDRDVERRAAALPDTIPEDW